jgi:CHAD domain-containing protein
MLKLLKEHTTTVDAQDTMPEAGRKILTTEFVKMLNVEAGSRTGEDIEDVHKMRVAIRRMRSAFRLLRPYYKSKITQEFGDDLRHIMSALGAVRDLDVLIHDLTQFQGKLDDEGRAVMQTVIEDLDHRRSVAREELNRVLDSKSYRRFQKEFTKFLTNPGAGVRSHDGASVTPYQVRHVLSLLIYKHLAAVRAYETVLENADPGTLHALRIEFKRLRYTISLFADVLGKDANDFTKELVAIQDHLGRINDISVAQERLHSIMDDLEGDQRPVLQAYLDNISAERPDLEAKLPEIWRRFNSKTVQRKLASAIAGL